MYASELLVFFMYVQLEFHQSSGVEQRGTIMFWSWSYLDQVWKTFLTSAQGSSV